MKITIWDLLSILLLVASLLVVVFVLQIVSDPTSSMNPFQPPSVPTLLVLPTRTNTPIRMPSTWTPTVGVRPTQPGEAVGTLRATWTPLPSPTGFVVNTWTPTITDTPTKTMTRTPTRTPTITPIPPTITPNLTGTYSAIATQLSSGQTATAAVATAHAVATTQAAPTKAP